MTHILSGQENGQVLHIPPTQAQSLRRRPRSWEVWLFQTCVLSLAYSCPAPKEGAFFTAHGTHEAAEGLFLARSKLPEQPNPLPG